MPSLFNRRSRSVSTSRPQPPASSSAHAAAAQAFLATRQSQSTLSASAAAAALRTMSPPPTPVDQIQTKRMVNRQSSNSSITSAPRGRSRGTVQRSPSGGSMTERTFRSPSPGRSSTPQGFGAGNNQDNAPSVPPPPTSYVTEDIPPIPAKSHRRSASMEAPPPRVLSPPPSQPRGRGQGTGKTATASNAATAAARLSAGVPPPALLERTDSTDSRNSFNFSYPRGIRPNSPPPRSPITPGTTNGISASEAAMIQKNLAKTAATPVKKKKKVTQPVAEGSFLQAGTVSSKPAGTAQDISSPTGAQDQLVQPKKKNKKLVSLTGPSSHFPDQQDDYLAETGSESDMTPEKIKRAQRASGVLAKQPSMVREDWEGEQEEDQPSPVSPTQPANTSATDESTRPAAVLPKKSLPEANMSRKMEEPISGPKPSSYNAVTMPAPQSTEKTQTLTPGESSDRHASISPSRSTRFSDRLSSDLASGRKHEPLGRSISPAKSALKQSSPAHSEASPVDGRFPHRRTSSVTPSEASDISTDGVARRKKSARVGFDMDSDGPGVGKEPESNAQASKDNGRKGWFVTGKPKTSSLGTIPAKDDVEEGMKPTPALPSFGSVRKPKPGEAPKTPTSKQDKIGTSSPGGTSPSTDDSSIRDSSTMNTSVSSDHAIGNLLFKGPQESKRPRDASRLMSEGERANASDTDSVYSQEDAPKSSYSMVTNSSSTEKQDKQAKSTNHNTYLPAISIQPATPGIDEMQAEREWVAEVPGGFPEMNSLNDLNESTESSLKQETPNRRNPSGLGMTESIYASPSGESDRSDVQALNTIEEEESDDNNSLYSDAAEDLSDLEGDGFGSINAIVGSPVPSSPLARLGSPAESPLASLPQRPNETVRTASWEDTQSHWSGIAQQFRNSAQQTQPVTAAPNREAQASSQDKKIVAGGPNLQPSAQLQPKSLKKNKQATALEPVPKRATVVQPMPLVPSSVTPSVVQNDKRSKRVSMNDQPQVGFRASMRSPPESTSTLRERPKSMAVTPTQPRAALQKKQIPPMQRTFSNDSDSDSSFRKARRNKQSVGGAYTMKRSMRGPAEPERTSVPANRRDVRSMSPVLRRPLSPTNAPPMRMSMRGSQDSGVPTLRGQKEHKRSSSLFSLGRKAKSPTRGSVVAPPVPATKSRFVDSDDELDAPRRNKFSSRFADSSDEEDGEPMRPVRGIPKKADQGDSTDLEDSSDDQRQKTKSPPKQLGIQIPPPSQTISPEPMSPATAKKRGLWGRLRGKKDSTEPNSGNTITQRNGAKPDIDPGKLSKSDKQLGFKSTAERDALVEQTRQKLEANKAQPAPASPVSPKLQRRMTPQRVFSDSGPLPLPLPVAAEERPNTSDGMGKPARPEFAQRQPTSETLRTNGGTAVYGRSGKPKRFPLLRKAFGLHD